ncbi:hypothetical protein TSAR_012986 [Trichomalopsis sarcophagae]|uniref:Uncharacterized protein n=1 Tax=Trichomalopsis sarcophagae TaxID=543379 RepID=A0A232ETQ6_9HYME|nr:hypothetical protein TSAR_012986 [Trichomalopsis sarcophagae]
MTKNRCKFCEMPGDGKHQLCQLQSLLQSQHAGILGGFYLQQLKDMMLAAYLLKGICSRGGDAAAADASSAVALNPACGAAASLFISKRVDPLFYYRCDS